MHVRIFVASNCFSIQPLRNSLKNPEIKFTWDTDDIKLNKNG